MTLVGGSILAGVYDGSYEDSDAGNVWSFNIEYQNISIITEARRIRKSWGIMSMPSPNAVMRIMLQHH